MDEAVTAHGAAQMNSRRDDGQAGLEDLPPDGEQAIAAGTPRDLLLRPGVAPAPTALPAVGLQLNPFGEVPGPAGVIHSSRASAQGFALPWSLIVLAAVVALALVWWRRTR